MRYPKTKLLLVVAALAGALASCSSDEPSAASAARTGTDNTFWPRHVVAEGYTNQTAIAADFTGDGLADVITNGDGKTRLYVAPDWVEVIIDDDDSRRRLIHSEVMDVDADGDPDFIGAVYSPGPIFWLERPDNPTQDPWTLHLIDEAVNGTHGLITGDVDGDTQLDLAGNSALSEDTPYPESLVWWKVLANPRQGERWERHVFADGDAPGLSHYLGLGDVNGDGKTDAASAAKSPPDGCVATFKKQQVSDWSGRSGSVSCTHLEQLVDELNLSPNIRTARPAAPAPSGSCALPRIPGSFASPPETHETPAWLSLVV